MTLAQVDLWSNIPILGPYALAFGALTTVSQQVLPADSTRNGVIFHNPGTQNKRVMPADSPLVGGSGGILIYPQSEYVLLQQPGAMFNVNCAWNAVTDNSGDGALTVLNFTANTPGAPQVQLTTRLSQQNQITSPTSTEVAIGTASGAVLPADPNRMGVQFNNPSAVEMAVCPSNLSASIGAGSIIILPGATKTIVGNSRVRINCAWNGIAQSGSQTISALGFYG